MAGVLALPQPQSEEESKILKEQALQGSPDAADHVVGWYLLLMGNGKLYWATIAAENGSRTGAYNMASILSDRGSLDSDPYGDNGRDRIWFWLKKAADHGSEYALEWVKREFPETDKVRPAPEQEIQRWRLSEQTLPKFKQVAMRGSPNAAYKLYEHYTSPHSEPKERLFWATIAAQNGHPKAPYVLGKLMLKSDQPSDQERAIFWLKKAAAAGDKDAIRLLQR